MHKTNITQALSKLQARINPINATAFLAGLAIGLSHYWAYKYTQAALDARDARLYEAALMLAVQSERDLDQAAAIAVQWCVIQSGDDCTVRVEGAK